MLFSRRDYDRHHVTVMARWLAICSEIKWRRWPSVTGADHRSDLAYSAAAHAPAAPHEAVAAFERGDINAAIEIAEAAVAALQAADPDLFFGSPTETEFFELLNRVTDNVENNRAAAYRAVRTNYARRDAYQLRRQARAKDKQTVEATS